MKFDENEYPYMKLDDMEFNNVVAIFKNHLADENKDTDYAFRAIRRWFHCAQTELNKNRDFDRIIDLINKKGG